MNPRTRIRRVGGAMCVLIIGALASLATPAAAQQFADYVPIERQDPSLFADRFLEAFHAGDEPALKAMALSSTAA